MNTQYVNSNIALNKPLSAAPAHTAPKRTSPVLSQRELREIVLQILG